MGYVTANSHAPRGRVTPTLPAQASPVAVRRVRFRVSDRDALGYITPSAIQSLVAKVTTQPAPPPTSTGASIYTTTPTTGSLGPAPAPIQPPTTAPIAPPPPPSAPPPPSGPMIETYAPPPSSPSSSPDTPSSGGTSFSPETPSGLTPPSGPSTSVRFTDGSSGGAFIPDEPEVYNADGSPVTQTAKAASFADTLKNLPTAAKLGGAVLLFVLLSGGKR